MAKTKYQDTKANQVSKSKLIVAGLGISSVLQGASGLQVQQSEVISQSAISDQHQHQTQQMEIQNLITKALDHVQKQSKGKSLSDAQLNTKIIEYMSNQSSTLLQTESEIQQKIFSEFKCVLGSNNCLYADQKSLKSGKMETKALATIKSTKSKAKKMAIKKPKNGQTISETETFMDEQEQMQKLEKMQDQMNAEDAQQAESAQQAKIEGKAVESPPVQKTNLQSSSDVRMEAEVEVESKTKGDPNKRLMEQLTAGLKNPVQDIQDKLASKLDNSNESMVIKDDIPTSIYKSPKRNFDIIYNSMFHGDTSDHHSDLAIEKKKVGENTKEMGKMSHNNAVNDNHGKDFKKGDLSHVQIDEGEQINTGSVEDAIESSKKLIDSHSNKNQKSDLKSSENQELLKKIDIQKMFQKIKGVPTKEVISHQDVVKDIAKTEGNVSDTAKKIVTTSVPVNFHAQVSSSEKLKAPIKAPAKSLMALAQKEFKKKSLVPAPIATPTPAPIATPSCPVQKTPECPKSNLVELAKKGNNFKLSVSDDTQLFENKAPEVVEFEILPKNLKDGVEKGINVLSQEKLMGYQQYLNSIGEQPLMQADDSEFYNVTVSMVIKKGSNYSLPPKQINLVLDTEDQESQSPPETTALLTSEEPEDSQNVQIDQTKVTQAEETRRLDVLRREQAEHDQHAKFEARIHKREEAILRYQQSEKDKQKGASSQKSIDTFNEDDEAANLKIINVAEKKSSEDQTEEEGGDDQESEDEPEQTQQHLAPVMYSPRKNPYPFYINEDYIDKQQRLMQEAKMQAEQQQNELIEQKMMQEKEQLEANQRQEVLKEEQEKERIAQEQREVERQAVAQEIQQTKQKLADLKKVKQQKVEEAAKKEQIAAAQLKKKQDAETAKREAEEQLKNAESLAATNAQSDSQMTLKERQEFLEQHISSEMAELSKIVNQQKDTSNEESYDFAMLRITKKNGQETHEEIFEPPTGVIGVKDVKDEDSVPKVKPEIRVKQLKKALDLKNKLESEQNEDQKLLHSKSKASKSDIVQVQSQTDVHITNKVHQHEKIKTLAEAKQKVIETANEALQAKAEVKAAVKFKVKAQKEKAHEQEVREKLMKDADRLAKADLETKAKIKKAAQMAAEVQKKTAQSYKDKLEREAREWLQKKEELEKEELAAKEAQDKAIKAAEEEKAEKAALAQEAKEREKMNKEEMLKAETKAEAGALLEVQAKQKVEKVTKEHKKAEKKMKKHQEQEKLKKKLEIQKMEQDEVDTDRLEKEFNEKTKTLSQDPDLDDFATQMEQIKQKSKAVDADSKKDFEPFDKKSEDTDQKDQIKKGNTDEKESDNKKNQMPHGQIDGESELNAIEKELIAAQKQADEYSKEHTQAALSKLGKDEVVANMDKTDDNKKKTIDKEVKDVKPEDIAQKITKEEDNNTEEHDKKPEKDLSELSEQPKKEYDIMQKSEMMTNATSATLAENQAIAEVRAAEKIGEKKGAEAAEKLLKKEKKMSQSQKEAEMAQLKKKLEKTSTKVSAIISHFSKVHEQINELKNEMIQQQQEGQDQGDDQDEEQEDQKVQLSQSVRLGGKSVSKQQASLQQSIIQKQNEMKETVKILKNIKTDLVQIKSESPEINAIRDKIALQISESEKTAAVDTTNQNLVQVQSDEQRDVEDIQLNMEDSLSSNELQQTSSSTVSTSESVSQLQETLSEAKKSNQIVQDRLSRLISEI